MKESFPEQPGGGQGVSTEDMGCLSRGLGAKGRRGLVAGNHEVREVFLALDKKEGPAAERENASMEGEHSWCSRKSAKAGGEEVCSIGLYAEAGPVGSLIPVSLATLLIFWQGFQKGAKKDCRLMRASGPLKNKIYRGPREPGGGWSTRPRVSGLLLEPGAGCPSLMAGSTWLASFRALPV